MGIVIAALVLPIAASGASDPAPKETTATAASTKRLAPAKVSLRSDVRNNVEDQSGNDSVIDVACASGSCVVDYRLGEMWDADDNEVARDIGGVLHELFRDTKVKRIELNAHTTTIDDLGNETNDDRVAWIDITRAQWDGIDWDNLQHREPASGLRSVADAYVDTLKN